MALVKRLVAQAIMVLVVAGCGSSQSSGEAAEAAAKPASKQPRGARAYPKERAREVEGLTAADARLLDQDGNEIALASTWDDSYAVLVVYRGHW